jgi:alpha-N-acetylglucosamine transferase
MSTVFALITDQLYFWKAEQTIKELRTRGKWDGPIVLATIDFNLTDDFKTKYNVTETKFAPIDKTELIQKIGPNGFANSDKRELGKLNQWEKLHIFDEYFTEWSRVVFLDAGLRVLDTVEHLLELDYKGKFLAPNDCAPYFHPDKVFKHQLDFGNLELIDKVRADFGSKIFESQYFLNCMWIYDTDILKICDKNQMIQAMNDYPLCRTNEMTIMNLLLHFKYGVWQEFPIRTLSGEKYLFEWNETNHPFPTNWTDYCFMKYPYFHIS